MSVLQSTLSFTGRFATRAKLSILIYHQVLNEFDPMRPSEPVAHQFGWQMALLARYFTPLSLSDALRRLYNDCLPSNAVCVTFDDGYLNNLTVAQPILQEYSIPATVYVATAFSEGSNMWNDRLIHLFADPARHRLQLGEENVELGNWDQRLQLAQRSIDNLKYLPWQERLEQVDILYRINEAVEASPNMMTPGQLKVLADKGVDIGAHTVNHPILKQLSAADQRHEVRQSKDQLEAWTGHPVRHFAYPNGIAGRDLDDEAVRQVRDAGFDSAVVTDPGIATAATSPWLLPRFTPWDRTQLGFQLRLLRHRLFSAA